MRSLTSKLKRMNEEEIYYDYRTDSHGKPIK